MTTDEYNKLKILMLENFREMREMIEHKFDTAIQKINAIGEFTEGYEKWNKVPMKKVEYPEVSPTVLPDHNGEPKEYY